MSKHFTGTAMTMVLLLFATPMAHADMIYNVTLDTSALTGVSGSGQGPFNVDFQLNDGSTGDGVGNNTATVTNFNMNGGSLTSGTDSSFGGVSGVLGNNVNPLTITDSGFLNEFNQAFTPGNSLSFTLDLTTNVSLSEAGQGLNPGSPDQFSFAVYSNGGTNVASLLTIDITGLNPVPITTPGSLGNGTPVSAPSVVPEPASLTLFAVALATLAAGWNCQRRRSAASVHPEVRSL